MNRTFPWRPYRRQDSADAIIWPHGRNHGSRDYVVGKRILALWSGETSIKDARFACMRLALRPQDLAAILQDQKYSWCETTAGKRLFIYQQTGKSVSIAACHCTSMNTKMIQIFRKPIPLPLAALAAGWLVAGCASSPPPSYVGQGVKASPNARTVELDGVRATAEVFADPDRCRTYFKLPSAYSGGLAILYVRIENVDSHLSLIAQRSGIQLAAGEGEAAAGQTAQSTSGAQTIALAGAALGSTPLLLIAGSMISQASVVQENFVAQEFRDETIGPHSTASGFAYFQLDKKTLLKNGGLVKVTLRRPLSQTEIHLQIPIPQL